MTEPETKVLLPEDEARTRLTRAARALRVLADRVRETAKNIDEVAACTDDALADPENAYGWWVEADNAAEDVGHLANAMADVDHMVISIRSVTHWRWEQTEERMSRIEDGLRSIAAHGFNSDNWSARVEAALTGTDRENVVDLHPRH